MSRSFLGQSVLYAVASVAPILVNVAVTPFVTRILGASEYGIVAVSVSLFQFGIVIFTLGLAASITRQAIITATGAAGAVATVLTGAACALLLFVMALISLPGWGPLILPGHDVAILVSPLISCLGLAFLQNAQSFFRAEQRVVTFVAMSAAASILAPLVGVASLFIWEESGGTYVAGLAATHLAVGVFGVLKCVAMSRPRFVRADFRTNLRIGLPTVPHQMATSFLTLVLVTVTSNSAGLDNAGALQIGLLIGAAPMLLIGAFNNAWAPLIYRAGDVQRKYVLARTYRGFMLLTVMLVLGFAVLSPLVVPLVAGPLATSMPVAQVALIAVLGAPFMTSYLANIHLVFLSGRTTALAITTPMAAAASAAVTVALPSFIGLHLDIRLIAFAVPLFQVLQWIISVRLRRIRSAIEVPVLQLFPEFGVILLTLLVSFVFIDSFMVVVFSTVVLFIGLCWYRRGFILDYLRMRRKVVA